MKTAHKLIGRDLSRNQNNRDRLRQALEDRGSPNAVIAKSRERMALNKNLGRRATVAVVMTVLDEEIRRAAIPLQSPPEVIGLADWELPWYDRKPAESYPDGLLLPE